VATLDDESPLEVFPGLSESPNSGRLRSETDPYSVSPTRKDGTLGRARTDEVVIRAGFMTKEGMTVKSWRRRWFVLTSDGLAYYPDQKSKASIKKLPLWSIVGVKHNKDRQEVNLIELMTSARSFFVCANSEEDLEEWLFAFNYALDNLKKDTSPEDQTQAQAQVQAQVQALVSPLSSMIFKAGDRRTWAFSLRRTESSMSTSPVAAPVVEGPVPVIERRNAAVLPPIDPNEIVKTGYLVKQGDSVKVFFFLLLSGS